MNARGHTGGAGRAVRDGRGTRGDGDLLGGVDGGLNLGGDGRSQETSENCGLHLEVFFRFFFLCWRDLNVSFRVILVWT